MNAINRAELLKQILLNVYLEVSNLSTEAIISLIQDLKSFEDVTLMRYTMILFIINYCSPGLKTVSQKYLQSDLLTIVVNTDN
jgi:hypothetical protein